MGLFSKSEKKDDLTAELEKYSSDPANVSTIPAFDVLSAVGKAAAEINKETAVGCVRMELTDTKPSIWESKVGGIGYIPHDGDFPQDSKGNQLRLLAQINCADVSLEDFPEQGLLQFWILNNDLSGADFDNNTKQDGFRIIYYADTDKSVTEEEIMSKFTDNEFDEDDMMPVMGEYGLSFKADTDIMSEHDCRFEKKFCEKYNKLNPPEPADSMYDIDAELEEAESYKESMDKAFGHKIGGYPGFTQWDPRDENTPYDFILLQLDSDFGNGKDRLMWGDSGIANFFINREKLKQLDFSDVLYNWDCC